MTLNEVKEALSVDFTDHDIYIQSLIDYAIARAKVMVGTTDIYNNTIVYEHGYFNSATEKSMRDQMTKRGQQIKKHVEYFRSADKHHVCAYDASKLVLNGALFGVDSTGSEYSGVLGFSSIPAQVIMWHQEEPSIGKSQVKETHIVQLAQI